METYITDNRRIALNNIIIDNTGGIKDLDQHINNIWLQKSKESYTMI